MVKALLFMFPYHLTQGAHNAMEQAKVVPNMGRIFLVLALQINWGGGAHQIRVCIYEFE